MARRLAKIGKLDRKISFKKPTLTGYVPSLEEWNKILQIAKDHNLIVFSDELYRGSTHDGSILPSAAALYEHAVALSGVSKVYGLPGIRMGM